MHFKLVLSPKMFYGHANMFIGGNTAAYERIEVFTFSGLPLMRLVDTKLTSIWTAL